VGIELITKRSPIKWFTLAGVLRAVGYVALLAFAAALMPDHWHAETSRRLGIDPFPDSPLTYYLARHLSLLYGFVGVLMIYLARDVDRHLGTIHLMSWCAVALGILQAVIDLMAALPWWWTIGESGSTLLGGLFLIALVARQDAPASERGGSS